MRWATCGSGVLHSCVLYIDRLWWVVSFNKNVTESPAGCALIYRSTLWMFRVVVLFTGRTVWWNMYCITCTVVSCPWGWRQAEVSHPLTVQRWICATWKLFSRWSCWSRAQKEEPECPQMTLLVRWYLNNTNGETAFFLFFLFFFLPAVKKSFIFQIPRWHGTLSTCPSSDH